MKRIAWVVAALCFASSAFAATVEVKAAKGVEKHEPVGEATEFAVKDTVEIVAGDGSKLGEVTFTVK